MKKKIVSKIVLIILLISTLTLVLNTRQAQSQPPSIWIVDDDGPADFHTIQEAINHANEGDTVFVRSGTYYEHVVVNKTVSLIGNQAIIDGSSSGTVVTITSSYTTIANFVIRNSGTDVWPPSGIKLCGNGHDNVVTRNTATNNRYGVHLDYSSHNNITDNVISQNIVGIRLDEGTGGSYIIGNQVSQCLWGITQDDAFGGSYIIGNTIVTLGGGEGLTLGGTPPGTNRICHNSFCVLYGVQARELNNWPNYWDNGYPDGGNYWIDYSGIDQYHGPDQDILGNDGIGDTPYIIGPNNIDRYPIMNPWSEPPVLYQLNVTSTPFAGIPFTVNAISKTTPYTESLPEGYYTIEMPQTYNGYEWSRWLEDGDTNRIKSVALTSENTLTAIYVQLPIRKHTLTIESIPAGITFTVDITSHTTPWSGAFDEGVSVDLVMPESYIVGVARYVWDKWDDGVTSRSRTVTMNTDISLTAKFAGPNYQLTVTSTLITGIPFTINTTSKTTPYTDSLPEGYYTIEMPQTYNGYKWSKWLEDGDTNNFKTIYLHGTTWTGVYVKVSPPTPPVGGEWVPIAMQILSPNTLHLLAFWIALASIIAVAVSVVGVRRIKKRRH
jgi:parallel beta-helix repeat protein